MLALLMTLSSPVVAQDTATGGGVVILGELTATERMSRGKLDACELTYFLAYEDYIYRSGAVTLLRGSMSFLGFISSPDSSPAFSVKVTAFDVDGETTRLFPLEYVYLTSQGVSYAGKEFAISEADDGGIFVGYEALTYSSLNFLNPVTLNILRKGGTSDISIPINFMIQKPDISMQYAACVIKLLDAISEKFN